MKWVLPPLALVRFNVAGRVLSLARVVNCRSISHRVLVCFDLRGSAWNRIADENDGKRRAANNGGNVRTRIGAGTSAAERVRKGIAWAAANSPGGLLMARRKSVRLGKGSTETAAQSNSHKLLIPPPRAAVSLAGWASGYTVGEVDISTLFSDLLAQSKRVAEGQVTHVECILLAQATTLDAMFHALANRAARNIGTYLEATDTYLCLAFRAQSQCRATIETIPLIKNPKAVAFVQQTNIAHGPQQVSNASPPAASRARKTEIKPSKLSGSNLELPQNIRASPLTSRNDPQMEAAGEIERTEIRRG